MGELIQLRAREPGDARDYYHGFCDPDSRRLKMSESIPHITQIVMDVTVEPLVMWDDEVAVRADGSLAGVIIGDVTNPWRQDMSIVTLYIPSSQDSEEMASVFMSKLNDAHDQQQS